MRLQQSATQPDHAVLGLVSQSEFQEFECILLEAMPSPRDFVLTVALPPTECRANFGAIRGWVTVSQGTTSRTYPIGENRNWLTAFRRHLDDGVFGQMQTG